eukprot:GHVU01173366.1.p1 GENE.GHVU01173366.1~~GHVU01173366.1.p1  ORF type:complete len:849 (-),score=82.73 GHVU01173366.1:1182-3413(-)
MKPPSFFCENETKRGLTLHYRSRRKGYLHYVIGQIRQVGLHFYNTPIDIEVTLEEDTLDMTHVVMQLIFDNTAFKDADEELYTTVDSIPINSEIFFDVFPFHIVFNQAMTIKNIGCGLDNVMPQIVGQALDEMFSLTRPMVEFRIEPIRRMQQGNSASSLAENDNNSENTFNMTGLGGCTCTPSHTHCRNQDSRKFVQSWFEEDDGVDDTRQRLRLKGQMMFMVEWQAVIFLGTPIMENLDKMFETGLYINDLSMHDSSRDLVLAGTQQSAELKLALDQEQQKSKKLEESMRKLDVEMKRTDSLLYQMIPKAVADRLRKGEPAMTTCEIFEQVTILFSDVVGFTRICSQISPMAVVSMLNAMYTKFDKLSEKHRVYKVETIGDAYMVVSGAPVVTKFHALYICDMALDMLDSMVDIIDPSTGSNMRIRIGIHSGTVVAGVVGLKMPRYCLFGDTVNTASRMETNGEAMKIHISEMTKKHLDGFPYVTEERGIVEIQGKVMITTYWLKAKLQSEGASIPLAPLEDDTDIIGNLAMHNFTDIGTENLYSPVTFADLDKLNKSPLKCPLHLGVESLGPGYAANSKPTDGCQKSLSSSSDGCQNPAGACQKPDGCCQNPSDGCQKPTTPSSPAKIQNSSAGVFQRPSGAFQKYPVGCKKEDNVRNNSSSHSNSFPAESPVRKVTDFLPLDPVQNNAHQLTKTTNVKSKAADVSPSKDTPVYFNKLEGSPTKDEKLSVLSQRLNGLVD